MAKPKGAVSMTKNDQNLQKYQKTSVKSYVIHCIKSPSCHRSCCICKIHMHYVVFRCVLCRGMGDKWVLASLSSRTRMEGAGDIRYGRTKMRYGRTLMGYCSENIRSKNTKC